MQNKLLLKIQALTAPVYTKTDISLEPWTFFESPDFSSLTIPDSPATVGYVLDFSSAGAIPTPWNPGLDTAEGKDEGDSTATYDEASEQQLNWTVFNTALGDDDYEKATAELTKISQMATLRQDTFAKAMEVYKEKIARINEAESNNKDKT